MPDRASRWITVREPFNFYWPSRAVTHFSEAGDFLVKDEVADFAVEKGYATEGKVDGSAKSKKGGVKAIRARRKKKDAAAAKEAANARPIAPVADAGAPDADRPADRPAVDSDAG